jgi:PAS domain-containing protein
VDEDLHRAATGPAHAVGEEPASRELARRVPWLRLEQVLPAAAYAAQAVLAAGSGTAAHGAVLRHLVPALGVAWGILWWSDRELRAVDIWPSSLLAEHAVRPPPPGKPPDLVEAVTWSTTEPGGRLWQSGLHTRLVVPLRSAGTVVGALELLGPVACPRPGRVRTGSVPPGRLDVLGDLLGAALVSAHELDEAREEATLLAAELEVVPAATVVVSPERKLLSVNERFLEMFAVPRSQAQPGGATAQTLPQIYALAVNEMPGLLALLDLAHTPGTGDIHRTITQRSGRVLDVRGAPVVDRNGVYRGRAWFVRDETARHRAEQAVRMLADTLVASLLPPHLPDVPGARLASRWQASAAEAEIGGDFYDVFSTGADRWAISFGDVCGSGPEAAVVTALTRHTVRAVAVRRDPPSAVLAALNRALLSQQEEAQRFLTALQLELHRRLEGGFTVTVACGGHPPPFVRRADGRVERLGQLGTLLGVVDEPELTDVDEDLEVGDVLVLVTDGVLEARDKHGEELGDEGLTQLLAATPGDAEQLAGAVADLAAERRVGNKRDDFAVLAFAAV